VHSRLCWCFQAFWTIQFSLCAVPYLIGLKWTLWFFKKATKQLKERNETRARVGIDDFWNVLMSMQVVSNSGFIICIARAWVITGGIWVTKGEFERCSGKEMNLIRLLLQALFPIARVSTRARVFSRKKAALHISASLVPYCSDRVPATQVRLSWIQNKVKHWGIYKQVVKEATCNKNASSTEPEKSIAHGRFFVYLGWTLLLACLFPFFTFKIKQSNWFTENQYKLKASNNLA